MQYIHVRWPDASPDDPIELVSEVDDKGYEVRKVEIFADGTRGCASQAEEVHGTRLGEKPIPSVEEMAADPHFRATQISKEEFEKIWGSRLSSEVVA